MSTPEITPNAVCTEMQPGEARTVTLTIGKMPSNLSMTVTLGGDQSLVRVSDVSIFEEIHRALTEDEILDLPALPPSVRQNARRNGIDERSLVGQAGGSSFTVARNQTVDVTLLFNVPPQTLEGITVARLAIASSSFATAEVPVICVVGRASVAPPVDPPTVRIAVAPGETAERSCTILKVPVGGSVAACVVNGHGQVQLKTLVAMREQRRPATEEEIESLPPSLQEDARRNGFLEYVETGRSNGLTPLFVPAGQRLRADLVFSAPPSGFISLIEAKLIMCSPRWQLLEIPLGLVVGLFSVELLNSAVSVAQSESAELVVTVTSISGPPDTVHFSIDDDADRLSLAPDSMTFQAGKSTAGKVKLFASPDAPLGVLSTALVARAFEQNQMHSVPLRVEITAGGLSVSTRPFTLTARQGDTVTFDMTMFTEGGNRHIAFTPGKLPDGVRMDSAAIDIGPPAGVRTQPMRLFINRDAPLTNHAWMPIAWSANNGVQSGLVNLPLTIELQPDSRTFHQDIVTPSGTALGGFAELMISNDGKIVFRGHMHGSGFDPYAFRVGYFLRANGLTLALSDVFSGRVGGTIGGGSRDCDWNIETTSPLLKTYWANFRTANAEFNKWYDDTGVIGALTDFIGPLTEFLLGRVLAGPAIAAILVLGPELARIANLPITSPNAVPGSVILGGVLFLFGPLAAIPAVVAGVAIAAAADVKSRRMSQSEIDEATKVFGATLPIDRIRITNLEKRGSGPADETYFTTVNNIDQTILVCMGQDFNNDLGRLQSDIFIHELTHTWQIAHNAFSLEEIAGELKRPFLSSAQVGELYRPYFDGRPWRDIGSEGQAVLVAMWYDQYKADPHSERAQSDVLFPYIARNLRLGQP